MNKEKTFLALVTVGMLLIAVGIIMPIALVMTDSTFHGWHGWLYKIIFGIGAMTLMVGRLFTGYKGEDTRLKRLHRIEGWSAVFFCVAAFFMWYPPSEFVGFPTNFRDVLAFTMVGGAIQVYTSIMISSHRSKANK